MANEDSEQPTADGGRGDADERNDSSNNGGMLSTLKSKEILIPAAISAIGAVAASSGPDILRRLTQSTEQKGEEEAERFGERAVKGAKNGLGGAGGIAGKALSKAMGGGSSGAKKTRRLPIQRWTDVAVPVEKAYDAWLAFDQYPQFMHRVLNVEKKSNDKIEWQEKIWFSKRQWEGRITDKRKNDRIAWKTTSGMSHKGVVSFREYPLDTGFHLTYPCSYGVFPSPLLLPRSPGQLRAWGRAGEGPRHSSVRPQDACVAYPREPP